MKWNIVRACSITNFFIFINENSIKFASHFLSFFGNYDIILSSCYSEQCIMTPIELLQQHKSLRRKNSTLFGPLLQWQVHQFIFPPTSIKLSAFEACSSARARTTDKAQLAEVAKYTLNIQELLAANKYSKALASLNNLLNELDFECKELEGIYKTEYLSTTPKEISTPSQYEDFIRQLHRLEFALRLTLSRHSALILASLDCLDRLQNSEIFARLSTNQQENLARNFDKVSKAHAQISAKVEDYSSVKNIIHKHLSNAENIIHKHLSSTENSLRENFEIALATLAAQVAKIREKASTNSSYEEANNVATELYKTLISAHKKFYHDKSISISELHDQCKKAIDDAKPTLVKHRGWSEILHDIAFVILSTLSAGIAPLANKWFNNRYRFLATGPTNSEIQLNKFAKDISILTKEQPSVKIV